MIRAFIGKADRDDLRMRFGQWLDFHSEPILKRFFDIDGKSGELVCTLDDNGDISGILHRVLSLLRAALARALQQNLQMLRALVLGENRAMLRLARKMGALPRQSAGLSVELEFNLSQICAGAMTPLPAAAATTKPPTSTLC